VNILILGAGQVGSSVAEGLVSEENDITLVDTDAEQLHYLQDRFDLRTVCGNASLPSVLRQAGIEDTDLLIAVTQSDQINLVACKIAHSIFKVPTRIARLRSPEFLSDETLLSEDNFAVNFVICPEQIITEYILRLVDFPEALQVLDFARGRISMVAVRAYEGGLLVGHPISEMDTHFSSAYRISRANIALPIGINQPHCAHIEARIAAIFRQNQPVAPTGHTVLQPGDEVFLLAASEHIRTVLRELRRDLVPSRRIMIAGGGHIGQRVASALEKDHEVKIVEGDSKRAEALAESLGNALVLCGAATDTDLLEQENIAEMDLFLALTNDEEDNIMAATLAKRLGCKRVAALVNRRAYAEVLEGGPIDISISPSQISIGPLLAHVRQGDVSQVHPLRRGAAEALEIVAHGDHKTSRIVGRRINEIDWPPGVTVGALVRSIGPQPEESLEAARKSAMSSGQVIMKHDAIIQENDHVVIFCTEKKLVRQVIKLFQVGFGFF